VTVARCSVSSPRHLEPCLRFSRTRLADARSPAVVGFPANPGKVWGRRRFPTKRPTRADRARRIRGTGASAVGPGRQPRRAGPTDRAGLHGKRRAVRRLGGVRAAHPRRRPGGPMHRRTADAENQATRGALVHLRAPRHDRGAARAGAGGHLPGRQSVKVARLIRHSDAHAASLCRRFRAVSADFHSANRPPV
jgi:hypothetical protein